MARTRSGDVRILRADILVAGCNEWGEGMHGDYYRGDWFSISVAISLSESISKCESDAFSFSVAITFGFGKSVCVSESISVTVAVNFHFGFRLTIVKRECINQSVCLG